MKTKTYYEMILKPSFESRLSYLKLNQTPAEHTWGGLRQLNQVFYTSQLWKRIRQTVIARDRGFDLGCEDYVIHGNVYVHHMNPITPHVLEHETHLALDPMYLITVSHATHMEIHYGVGETQKEHFAIRVPNDTKDW